MLISERFLFHVQQTGQGFGVITEINLGPYEDIRHMGHAILQLRDPFLLDIVVRGRIHDREADQKHVGVGVGQWPQLVVILLSCSVVQSKQMLLASHSHSNCIVVKDSGHVFLWEGIIGVAHQQAGLPHSAIPHHHTLQHLLLFIATAATAVVISLLAVHSCSSSCAAAVASPATPEAHEEGEVSDRLPSLPWSTLGQRDKSKVASMCRLVYHAGKER